MTGSLDQSIGRTTTTTDFSEGKQTGTDNPMDMAIAGQGFFVVMGPNGLLYTRHGAFQRDHDGRLTTLDGLAVQGEGGGDIVLKSAAFQVMEDGTVMDAGQPAGRLAVVDFENRDSLSRVDGGLFVAAQDSARAVKDPVVRQGMLETSNVSTGDEMITIMAAIRRAETGQRLVNVYDDLMGRALSAFGQA